MYLSFLYLYAIVIQTQKQPESVDLEQAKSGLMSTASRVDLDNAVGQLEWIQGQPELSEKKIWIVHRFLYMLL